MQLLAHPRQRFRARPCSVQWSEADHPHPPHTPPPPVRPTQHRPLNLPPPHTSHTPDAGGKVVLLKLIALLLAAVAPDGRHIDHAVAELNKGAALDGDVNVWGRGVLKGNQSPTGATHVLGSPSSGRGEAARRA